MVRIDLRDFHFARLKMARESLANSPAQRFRTLDEEVAQSSKEIREFLFRPTEHILAEPAAARAEFDHCDLIWRAQRAPHLFQLAGEQATEDCVHVARCVEIASFAKLLSASRVVTKFRIIETMFHVARKGHRSKLAN